MIPPRTPTPWKNLQNGKDEWFVMGHPNKTVICNQCVSKEDAAFIVRAVNCHEELLLNLKLAASHLESFINTADKDGYVIAPDSVERVYLSRINQAIAKAESRS